MGLEIERKFLVSSDAWRRAARGRELLRQGYLSNNSRCSVRVRTVETAAWISVKAMTPGIARAEYEYPIDPADAAAMLTDLCEPPLIEKWRYDVPHGGHAWEVDEFLGENASLVIAELELATVDEEFERPEWLGIEVTADRRFYNFSLASHPWRCFAQEFAPTARVARRAGA
jgi:adenylate cyclase